MPEFVGRMGLGTVQFGVDYGVANRDGRPSEEQASAVVRAAAEAGIEVLDTAPRYGDAEARLGRAGLGRLPLRVVTKTPAADPEVDPQRRIVEGLERSLERLGVPRVHALLEHRPEVLLGPRAESTWRGLCAAHEAGLTDAVGASVTHPEQLDRLLERYPLHVVQLPFSVLDQRFLTPPRVDRLAALGVEVHARSALLQGALVGDPASVAHVSGLPGSIASFQIRCAQLGVTPLEAALGVPLLNPAIDVVLVGVQSLSQLEQCLRATAKASTIDPGQFQDLARGERQLVDPTCWPEPAR